MREAARGSRQQVQPGAAAPAPAQPQAQAQPVGLGTAQHGAHSMPIGQINPQQAARNPLAAAPVTGPNETQPGVVRPVVQAQLQSHQVVRRGDFAPSPQAPIGSGAYAPRSGQEVPVPGRTMPTPAPRPQHSVVQETPQADVTVILYSSGQGGNALALQVQALSRQSVHARHVWVHADGPSGHDERTLGRMTAHRTPVHFGRYFRMSLARNVTTRYVAILDEDTIPGRRWLERTVLALMEEDEAAGAEGQALPFGAAVLAGAGSVLASDDPADVRLVGPELPRDEPVSVDFGRQSWVFSAALARIADGIPRVGGSPVAFGFAMSAAAAAAGLPTVVLDYGVDRDDWLATAEQALVSPAQDVYAAYANYRGVGWEPSFAAQGTNPGDPPNEGGAVVEAPRPVQAEAEPAAQIPADQPQGLPQQGASSFAQGLGQMTGMPVAAQEQPAQAQALAPQPQLGQSNPGEVVAGQPIPAGARVTRQGTGQDSVTTVETVLATPTPPPQNMSTERIVGPSQPPAQAGRETVLGQPQEGEPSR